MKQRRLRQAISEASELRAFIVLVIVAFLRAWHLAPNLPDLIIENWRHKVNKWLTYFLYHEVHWVRK